MLTEGFEVKKSATECKKRCIEIEKEAGVVQLVVYNKSLRPKLFVVRLGTEVQ